MTPGLLAASVSSVSLPPCQMNQMLAPSGSTIQAARGHGVRGRERQPCYAIANNSDNAGNAGSLDFCFQPVSSMLSAARLQAERTQPDRHSLRTAMLMHVARGPRAQQDGRRRGRTPMTRHDCCTHFRWLPYVLEHEDEVRLGAADGEGMEIRSRQSATIRSCHSDGKRDPQSKICWLAMEGATQTSAQVGI